MVRNIKTKLKKEYTEIMMMEFPHAFEKVESHLSIILQNNFTKMTTLPKNILTRINKLGPNVVGYIYILTQSLKVGNMVDYNIYEDNGYSKALVDQKIKPIFKKNGIVKKRGSSFYLNPLIAVREKAIDKDIINLFEEDNKRIFGIVLK